MAFADPSPTAEPAAEMIISADIFVPRVTWKQRGGGGVISVWGITQYYRRLRKKIHAADGHVPSSFPVVDKRWQVIYIFHFSKWRSCIQFE